MRISFYKAKNRILTKAYRHVIQFLFWRFSPLISSIYFKYEHQGLMEYLAAGEPNKPSSEIRKTDLKLVIGNAKNIIEIGANDGRDTVELSIVFPNAKIFAVECDSRLFGSFYDRTKLNCNISLYPFAAWDDKTFRKLFESSGESFGSSSLLEPNLIKTKYPEIDFSHTVVNASKVSELIKILDLPFVDLVWVDVQGAEMNILKDLKSSLHRIGAIYLEVEVYEMYKGEALYPEILEFFTKNGFVLYKEYANEISPQNALFLNKTIQG
jgi:FkbM family methyltransferase